jgi:DNA-binding NarL/FixJ family response regulator
MADDHDGLLAGKKVLIAEDEPLVALEHRDILSGAGAEIVGTCSTVHQALKCLERAAIDVAVVDYLLADRNSEPLQAALKKKHIPFVVVSSYPRALIRSDESQNVLRKPVLPSELRGEVAGACRRAA